MPHEDLPFTRTNFRPDGSVQVKHPYTGKWLDLGPETRYTLRCEYDLASDEELRTGRDRTEKGG